MRHRTSMVLISTLFVAIALMANSAVHAQNPGPLLLRFCASPLMERHHTVATYQIDSTEIRRLPLREVEDVVSLLPGVVVDRRDGALHIRGSQGYRNEFSLDGVPMSDAFTGVPRFVLGQDAIGSVSLDTRREYSFAAPEIVATQSPAFANQIHGAVEAVTDNFHGDKEDYNIYSGSVSGPLLRGTDRLSFDANVERRWYNGGRWNWFGNLRYATSDVQATFGTTGIDADWRSYPRAYLFDYAHAPRYTLKDNTVFGTAAFGDPDGAHLKVYADWHQTKGKSGDGVYFDNLWGYGRPTGNPQADETDLFYSWDNLHIDASRDQIVTPTYDSMLTVPFWYDQNNNGVVDEGEPYYLDGKPRDINFTYNFTRIDSVVGETEYTTQFADESHVWDDYSAYEWSSIGGRVEAGERGELLALPMMVQAEFDVRRHTVRSYQNYFPTRIYQGAAGGFTDIDSYGYDVLGNPSDAANGLNGVKHPIDLGGYIGGEARLHDLRLSGGVRIDRFDYDAMALRDPANPLDPDGYADPSVTPNPTEEQLLEAQQLNATDLVDAETYTRYSPRIFADLQLGRNTSSHLGLRQSYQRPPLEALYANFDFLEYKVKNGGYAVTFGNAALEPMSTMQYEAGISQRVNDHLALSVTGFYKDFDHILGVATQPAQPTSFTTIVAKGTATAKGLEFRVVRHADQTKGGVSCELNYTLQQVQGTNDYYRTQRNVAWTVSEPTPYTDVPLYYDRRHTFAGVFGYSTGKGQVGMRALDDLDAFAVFRAESGFPYTRSQVYNAVTLGNANPVAAEAPNESRMPSVYRLDLQVTKRVPVQRLSVEVFLWVINVFDRENPIDVYATTGDPDNTGWLETQAGNAFLQNNPVPTDISGLDGEGKYRLRENDPGFYDLPRQIRLGARVMF